MADELRMALADVLRKAGVEDADFLREGMRVLAQELMDIELEQHLGAGRHERTPERSGYRNGTRERTWDTRVGAIELQVPRVRDGSFFPSCRSDWASRIHARAGDGSRDDPHRFRPT
jgi:transposase-like protein